MKPKLNLSEKAFVNASIQKNRQTLSDKHKERKKTQFFQNIGT